VRADRTRSEWWAGLALIAVVGAALYAAVLDAPFYYDDYDNIVDNPRVHWTELRLDAWVLAALDSPTRRPVAYWSFGLNHYFGGRDVRGYRAVNVAIHLVTALLVAWLTRFGLSRLPAAPSQIGAQRIALLAGMIFVAHPLQIQSVTYVVQRMNSLAALFYLAACAGFLCGRVAAGGRRLAWYGAAGVAGLLAVGSKEVAITLPLAWWLFEWFLFRDLSRDFARRSFWRGGVPLLLLAGGAYAAFLYGPSWVDVPREFTLAERLLTELRVVVFYLGLILLPLPSRLNLLHDFPLSRSLLDPLTTLAAALFLLVALGLAWGSARRAPLVAFGLVWFLLQLALESSVLPLALVYEHRTYLPLAGIAMAVAWGVFRLSAMRPSRALPVGIALVGLLALSTLLRNQVWRDEIRLWSDVAAKSPLQVPAHTNLGTALLRAGRSDAAIAAYRAALALDPGHAEAINNLGTVLLHTGDEQAALEHFRDAVERDPTHYRARHNLARALAERGRTAEALEQLQAALRLAPLQAQLWNGLGAVFVAQQRLDEAAAAFRSALQLDPGLEEARQNLSVVTARLEERGTESAAIRHFRELLARAPQTAAARAQLGVLLAAEGRTAEAMRELSEAVRLDPSDATAANNLAWLLATAERAELRDPPRALELVQAARRAGPADDPGLLDTLAAAHAAAGRFDEAARWAARALESSDSLSPAARDAIRRRLELYRAGRPYVEGRAS
jgi:Flp pilus assembly protein TadD